jgi:UDP-N-acetylmuramoyl-tripeptide--D-alanyl-D-alanine ligase
VNRTRDFRTVAKRRTIDYTIKAKVLILIAWFIYLGTLVAVVLLGLTFLYSPNTQSFILLALVTFVLPLLLPYLLVTPIILMTIFIQRPIEFVIIRDAKRKLANVTGKKIAIAGSYGKTTAKEILATVIKEGKNIAYTPGNMNTFRGISRFAKTLKGDEEVIIFELGEGRIGEVKELCELVRPDMGIITGISEAHLESFRTIENITSTIFELQDYLGDRPVYKNVDNELVASKVKNGDKFVYSQNGAGDWEVKSAKTDLEGIDLVVRKGKETISVHSNLVGLHNVGILVLALAIADDLGLTSSQIEFGIGKTEPFEHRLQPIKMNGSWLIDDSYNGNTEGIRVGLEFLKAVKATRKIYITPGLVEQGSKTKGIHEKIGRQIAKSADIVILMKNSVTDYIIKGLKDAHFKGEIKIVDDPLQFYLNIDQFLATGDVALMQNDWTDNFY